MNAPGDDRDGSDGDPPNRTPPAARNPARALTICTALVVGLFFVHVLVLVLVSPFEVLKLSKLNAYAISIIPLGMGIAFFFDAVMNFLDLEQRSPAHLVSFLFAVLFGTFSIHGLLGFLLYLVRHPPAI